MENRTFSEVRREQLRNFEVDQQIEIIVDLGQKLFDEDLKKYSEIRLELFTIIRLLEELKSFL